MKTIFFLKHPRLLSFIFLALVLSSFSTPKEEYCYYVAFARTSYINSNVYAYISGPFKAKCDIYSVGIKNQYNDEIKTINAEHAQLIVLSGATSSFEFSTYDEAAIFKRKKIGEFKSNKNVVSDVPFAYYED